MSFTRLKYDNCACQEATQRSVALCIIDYLAVK